MPRKTVRDLVARAAYATGVTQAVTRAGARWTLGGPAWPRPRRDSTFTVILYHRVNDTGVPLSIDTIDTAAFARQIEYLARTFTVCDLEEIRARLESGRELPPRCAAITFDDGYRDNYERAFPELRSRGLPATIFLTAGNIERREPLWFDRVLTAFRRSQRPELAGENGSRAPLGTVEEKWRAALRVLMELKNLDVEDRTDRIARLYETLDVNPSSAEPDLLLTWDEVREMSGQGITFGSHTMTHFVLSRCTPERARWELIESKRLIESQVGKPVRLLAYPHGKLEDFSSDVARYAREAGYGLALTTVWGTNSAQDDRFQLRRMSPWPADVPSFALSLASALLDGSGR
jgi:peptidoglycan/xylan/chitin deacetylase (PgdA/CDA1 family)